MGSNSYFIENTCCFLFRHRFRCSFVIYKKRRAKRKRSTHTHTEYSCCVTFGLKNSFSFKGTLEWRRCFIFIFQMKNSKFFFGVSKKWSAARRKKNWEVIITLLSNIIIWRAVSFWPNFMVHGILPSVFLLVKPFDINDTQNEKKQNKQNKKLRKEGQRQHGRSVGK